MRTGMKGFSLIELVVTLIIVGILASLAGPMMSKNLLKAKKSEVMATLGAIRTAMRLYYMEHRSCPNVSPGNIGNGIANLGSYIKRADLDGKYYNNMAYNAWGGATFGCAANTRISPDPKLSGDTNGGMIYLYNNGTTYSTGS